MIKMNLLQLHKIDKVWWRKIALKIYIILMICLVIVHCRSSNRKEINGFSEYHPKSKLFSLFPPVGYGGWYEEKDDYVAFYDPFFSFYMIDHGPLPAHQVKNLENIEIKEQLTMIGENIFKMRFEANVPGAKIEKEEFIIHDNEISLFMVIFLPKGSTYIKNRAREDVERGLLIFKKSNFVFFLHTQTRPRLIQSDMQEAPVEEKRLKLKESLIELKDRIKFNI